MTVRETLEDNMPVTKPMCFIHLRTTTCELTYGLSKVCFGAESGNLYHVLSSMNFWNILEVNMSGMDFVTYYD